MLNKRVPNDCYHLVTDFASQSCMKMASSRERTMIGDSRASSTQNIPDSANTPSDDNIGLVSNDALLSRRRRETARHACQNCRRRKIKVCQYSKLCQATTWHDCAVRRISSELQAMFESQSRLQIRIFSWPDPEPGTVREPTSTTRSIAYLHVTDLRLALRGFERFGSNFTSSTARGLRWNSAMWWFQL